MVAGDPSNPDPSVLATEQLFRESGKLGERIDRQDVWLTAVDQRADNLGSTIAALASKQDGDIKRLSSEIAWSNRAVDAGLKSHAEVHALNEKHVDIAREAQEHRNQALNNERARQSERDKEFARSETMTVEVNGLRSQIDRNEERIRQLELGQRAILAEDSGAAGSKRSGQATVQQYASIVGAIVAVVAVIATIIIANLSTAGV